MCDRSVVVADSHKGASWTGKQLCWIRLSAQGAPSALGSGWDRLCEPLHGSCLHPGQAQDIPEHLFLHGMWSFNAWLK